MVDLYTGPIALEGRRSMKRWIWGVALALVAMLVAGTVPAQAGRTLSMRVQIQHNLGVRQDVTVPFLTTGKSTIMSGTSVAPIIYSSPNVDGAKNPQVVPVYNLIYQGARQGFGDRSNGAKARVP